jgi:hypothetical protein
VVVPLHLLSISCSLQIHVAPMFHSFQTDKVFKTKLHECCHHFENIKGLHCLLQT